MTLEMDITWTIMYLNAILINKVNVMKKCPPKSLAGTSYGKERLVSVFIDVESLLVQLKVFLLAA